ncbi:WXG100 family type VII secretion target [Intrasporangium flavum]|uniref:WXG100 family type VII secretion target n=1 Tax=Intrasporangium flavum TaxID=1428657 RepID=UPI00096D8A8E|nr:hypothetical protein [Intrasporangium flavum]
MYSKGADVDALRDSAGRMAAYGRDVDQVLARSRHAVAVVRRAWAGPDLGHVLERWRRVEADLTRISGRFGDLSRRLEHNADAQQRSSAGHGGPSFGGHGPGGSGGSGGHHGTDAGGHGGGSGSSGDSGGSGGRGGGASGEATFVAGPVHGSNHPGGHGGGHGSFVAEAGWHDVLGPWLPHVWGPDDGRPLVGAAQWQAPHPGPGMGWGQLVGSGWHEAGTGHGPGWQSFAPAGWAPLTPASVPALAAHQLGLPIR